MTNYINYTKDRFIDRDLNELVRIENMLKPYPDEVDLDNISIEHVLLKDEQEKLRGSVQRGAYAAGLKNPLKEKLYQATLSTIEQQPEDITNRLNATNSNVNNNQVETSVTNPDGSITLTRKRQINDNGTMKTQTGRIRLMPQNETAGGAPAVVGMVIKNQMFGLSEKLSGDAIVVSSGTRTKQQNDILVKKGLASPNSNHLNANAADINITGKTGGNTAVDAYNSGIFSRVNSYSDGRTHVDNLPRPSGTTGYYNNWHRVPNPSIRTKPAPPKR